MDAKQKSLVKALLPYQLRDIETAVNMYIWLVYNDFTPEDLRENLPLIRRIRERQGVNAFMFPLSFRTEYKDLPYGVMKLFHKFARQLKNGDITPEEMIETYKEERARVLDAENYGSQRCRTCGKQKEDWPMEILR